MQPNSQAEQREEGRVRLAVAAAFLLAGVVLLANGQALAHARSPAAAEMGPVVRNGDWIAYATAPASGDNRGGLVGSDVYITRAGGRPRLVAGRGSGKIWNVCP